MDTQTYENRDLETLGTNQPTNQPTSKQTNENKNKAQRNIITHNYVRYKRYEMLIIKQTRCNPLWLTALKAPTN